jgi:hypothetical protein
MMLRFLSGSLVNGSVRVEREEEEDLIRVSFSVVSCFSRPTMTILDLRLRPVTAK